MSKYNKHYLTVAEFAVRFDAFQKNIDKINKNNEEDDEAEYGINDLSDFTEEEYKKLLGLTVPPEENWNL